MRLAFEFIATLSATLFCGAAIYINLVEHPARMGCGTEIAATVWAPSYKRATIMQASLAILSFLCGVVVWVLGGGTLCLIGALFIGVGGSLHVYRHNADQSPVAGTRARSWLN